MSETSPIDIQNAQPVTYGRLTRPLIVNGRFLENRSTAVNTVARCLTLALLEADRPILVAVPPALRASALSYGLPALCHGTRSGLLWEQTELPSLRTQGVVTGFTNSVPLRGRGYVTMLHDAQVFTAPDSYPLPTRLWRKRILRQASRTGNHVLTVSAHSKANLLSLGLGKPRNIAVVPNGPGPAAHAIAAPLPRGISNARPFCLAFSSAQPHKNTAMLLRCFARPDMQDTTLVLVGMPVNGSVRSKNIVYTGHLSDQELAGLYAQASAVLIPSLQEGFGLPALEAMNHGTPVLVSDRGALPEVVEHAGLVLPAHDIEAWQIAIHRVSQAPRLRAELIAQGQRRAAELTWQNSANMVWQHLDRWFGTPRERG